MDYDEMEEAYGEDGYDYDPMMYREMMMEGFHFKPKKKIPTTFSGFMAEFIKDIEDVVCE